MRAVAHVHSEWSYDCDWPLGRVARLFARARCQVVLMTEHDLGYSEARWQEYRAACAAASLANTLLVPGIEYSDADNVVHVLVWGSEEFLGEGVETAELVRRAKDAGATAVLAHPGRRDAHARLDSATLALFDGIELWNRKYDGVAPGPVGHRLLGETRRRPWVGLDFHERRQFFPLTTKLDLQGRPDVESVLDALRRGAYRPHALGLPAAAVASAPARGGLGLLERVRLGVRRRVRGF